MTLWMSIAIATLAPAAQADPVTFNFTGVVNNSNGIWTSAVGTLVTGSYTYDSLLANSGVTPGFNRFYSDSPGGNQALGGWDITVNVGLVSGSTGDNANDPTTRHHFATVFDISIRDEFVIQADALAVGDDKARIQLTDVDPLPHPDAIAVGSGTMLVGPPTTAPDLSKFSELNSTFSFYQTWSADGVVEGFVNFTLTSITEATPIPEPGSLALLGIAIAGCAARRRRNKAV